MGVVDGNADVSGAPLAGITVLDLTRNLAGPYATMILGDLGARIIKVERPDTGDDTRQWMPPSWEGDSALFVALNRNKESLCVDIDSTGGAKVLRELAATADVFVESNKPDSLVKRGLGFEDIRKVNERIVYCSISGFGSRGPYRGRPGYDSIVQAASGVMSTNGEAGGGPSRVGPSIIDQGTGIWAALGVLSALRVRDSTGEAQHVQTSLMEVGISWMGYFITNYFAAGLVAEPQGSRHAQMAPYEAFFTKEGFLLIAALNDNLFRRLCGALGVEQLAEKDEYLSNADRVAHREALHQELQLVLYGRGATEWEAILVEKGVPCSVVRTVDQVVNDPNVLSLDMIRGAHHKRIQSYRVVDHPVSYNGIRSFQNEAPPDLGEHSRKILRDLGYNESEILALMDGGSSR